MFDIYGRFRVTAEQSSEGVWVLYRVGSEGKRERLADVVVPDHATPEEVERMLEAAFHELARPGTSIVRIDP
jgi:hypothetical protein